MRTILVLLALIIIVSAVSAAETDKWVYPGEPFTFEGETYYAFSDLSRMSIIIQSNTSRLILDMGECEKENFVRYCYEEVASQTDLDHIKFDTDNNILYGMKISLETLGPKIKVTQNYDTKSPDINSRIEGEVTVENTGNQRAYAVEVTWAANDSVSLRTCSECERSYRSFTKRFSSLDVDEKRTIAFALLVEEPKDFSSEANVTYEYEGEVGETKPISQKFTIKKPYSAMLSNPGKAPVGEWIDMSFTVKNTGDNDITITATPVENTSLIYENAPFNDARALEDLELEPDESESYAFRTLSRTAGSYGTAFDVTVRRDSETFEETVRKTPEWTLDDLVLIATLSKRSPASGDSNTLYVNVDNRGALTFRNLDVAFSGQVEDETQLESIGTDKLAEVFEERFTHPKTDTRLEREFNVTLRYDTQYGEEQTAERTIPYTIVPINESYEIRRVVDPKEPEVGEEFTVSVYGRKTVDSAVEYSRVVDRLIGARIEQGNNKLIPIQSPEEELLYQYDAVREDERFAIITSVDASFLGQTGRITEKYATYNLSDEDIENAIDTIDPSTVTGTNERNETTNETTTEENSTVEEEPEANDPFEEEEPGFFGRIGRWFANLFG